MSCGDCTFILEEEERWIMIRVNIWSMLYGICLLWGLTALHAAEEVEGVVITGGGQHKSTTFVQSGNDSYKLTASTSGSVSFNQSKTDGSGGVVDKSAPSATKSLPTSGFSLQLWGEINPPTGSGSGSGTIDLSWSATGVPNWFFISPAEKTVATNAEATLTSLKSGNAISSNWSSLPADCETVPAGSSLSNVSSITVKFTKAGEYTISSSKDGSTADAKITVNEVPFDIEVTFDDYNTRSNKHKAGIRETGSIKIVAKPGKDLNNDILSLQELKMGSGGGYMSLSNVNNATGTANFRANFEAGTATIQAKDKNGNTATYEMTVIKPSGVKIENIQSTSITTATSVKCGFIGNWYILPDDVSFKGVTISEDTCLGTGVGSLSVKMNERHNVGLDAICLSVVAGKGTDAGRDVISTGPYPKTWGAGSFYWDIPFRYQDGSNNPIQFCTVRHKEEITVNYVTLPIQKTLTISKGGESQPLTYTE